jgi:carbonic anhydrase/acetyltransferase-like protein (isoleucine patch superfamily)
MVKDHFKIPARSLVVGVPARIKRAVNRKEIERIISGANFYVDLSRDFKKQGLSIRRLKRGKMVLKNKV